MINKYIHLFEQNRKIKTKLNPKLKTKSIK